MENNNYRLLSDEELQKIDGSGTPLFYGANGYLTRENGKYKYVVTKGPLEATLGVITNGWAGTAAGGFGLKRH
ncbi:garvicin Q family class II bacteriocin [Lactococcus petauri]|uniref:garvicin Q family class II bacteriocin n=1 Tax=Lactococcus petauri TaxID=1940789 RepID=UPI0022E19228|nr:garvicin Q family class II bacteriocin [Lactococcus petauri]